MCLIQFYILYYMYCFAFPCSLSLIFTLFPNSALYIYFLPNIYIPVLPWGIFFWPFLHLFSSLSPSQHAELWWINLSEEQCHYKHGCIPLCMCMCVCKRVSLGKLVCTWQTAHTQSQRVFLGENKDTAFCFCSCFRLQCVFLMLW